MTMAPNSSSAGQAEEVGRATSHGDALAHARVHRLTLGRHRLAGVLADHGDQAGGRLDLIEPVVALEDARAHLAGETGGREPDLLRPHRRAVHEVGPAEEVRDERRRRPLVGLVRRADLLGAAVVHHHDAVAERHRLGLVVRHQDGGRADRALDLAQLDLHLLAQLGVEIGERLVEQQDLRPDHESAGQRHALLLAARQLARKAAGEGAEADQLQRLADAPGALGGGDALHLEPERHVLRHRHVREERIALEHDAEAALGGLDGQEIAAFEPDRAAARLDEARDHLQGRGLAAARRAQQRDELALLDGQVRPSTAVWVPKRLLRPSRDEERQMTSAPPRGSSAWSSPRAGR